jgi:anti-sigma factor RsiW
MNHEKIQELIFALYDGELNAFERKSAEHHLTECQDCRRLTEGWRAASAKYFKKPSTAPSEFFVRQTMARLQEVPLKRRGLSGTFAFRWLIPALGAAAVSMLIFFEPVSVNPSFDLLLGGPSSFEMAMIGGSSPTVNETLVYVLGG